MIHLVLCTRVKEAEIELTIADERREERRERRREEKILSPQFVVSLHLLQYDRIYHSGERERNRNDSRVACVFNCSS